jgi:hypothetical protein
VKLRYLPAFGGLLTMAAAVAACAETIAPPAEMPAPTAAPSLAPPPGKLHPGIRHTTVTRGGEHLFVAQILELDLTRPDLALVTTSRDASGGMEFIARRTTSYLDEIDALVAINASYFLPFAGGTKGGEDYYPHEGQPVNASGAVIAGGVVVSPVEPDLDLRVNAILCFERLAIAIADGQTCPARFANGVAAGPRLLADGERRSFAAFDNNYAATPQPRTAMGLSADGRRGWIIVVDGRQAGYSEGATLSALTDLFVELGASNAINLDGGGSATLVVAGENGAPRILNRPIHTGVPGRERPVANHIALIGTAPEE